MSIPPGEALLVVAMIGVFIWMCTFDEDTWGDY